MNPGKLLINAYEHTQPRRKRRKQTAAGLFQPWLVAEGAVRHGEERRVRSLGY